MKKLSSLAVKAVYGGVIANPNREPRPLMPDEQAAEMRDEYNRFFNVEIAY